MTQYAILAEYATGTQAVGLARNDKEAACRTLKFVKKHYPKAQRYVMIEREVGDWRICQPIEEEEK